MRRRIKLAAVGLSASLALALALSVSTASPATSDTGSGTLCGAPIVGAPQDEACAFGVIVVPDGQETLTPNEADTVTLIENAIEQTVDAGDEPGARSFIDAARDHFAAEAIERMEAAIEHRPDHPVRHAGGPGDLINMSWPGSSRLESENLAYYAVYSNGSTYTVSVTRAEYNHYIAVNNSDWGDKNLAFHLDKISGLTTYYSDVDCEIRHVDWFSDSTVATWSCRSPVYNGPNSFDTGMMAKDYYGNRGDKYYNEFWFDVNPETAQYPTRRWNHEGPKWKNPDGGGAPFWL